jgi:membrane protein required for colicin V production
MLTAMDIIVLLLIGGGAVMGLLRGFVMEVLSLFAWAAAIFALKLLHGPVASLLVHVVKSPSGASVLAFVIVFGLVFLGGKMLAASLGQRTKKSVLGSFDRILGLGFGALKGLLIATVIFLGVNLAYDTIWGANSERPSFVRNSRTYPLLNASGRAVVDWVQRRRAHAADGGHENAAAVQTNGD